MCRTQPLPYADDLAALTNQPAFQQLAGTKIVQKLNLISKTANIAVHDNKLIRPDAALRVLDELYHVMVWAAFHHSPKPNAVPMGTRFDPQLAKKGCSPDPPRSRCTRAEVQGPG